MKTFGMASQRPNFALPFVSCYYCYCYYLLYTLCIIHTVAPGPWTLNLYVSGTYVHITVQDGCGRWHVVYSVLHVII
jgi:hypothetical protein